MHLERLHLLLASLLHEVGEQHGGQVALSEGGDDHHDVLARILRAAAHLQGCFHRGARRYSAQHTLLLYVVCSACISTSIRKTTVLATESTI
jgi:hypothetical protein